MAWRDLQQELKHQREMFRRLGVKKYVNFKRLACGHRVNIYDAKAGVCMECRMKERRYTPADSQAEMGFNTESLIANELVPASGAPGLLLR